MTRGLCRLVAVVLVAPFAACAPDGAETDVGFALPGSFDSLDSLDAVATDSDGAPSDIDAAAQADASDDVPAGDGSPATDGGGIADPPKCAVGASHCEGLMLATCSPARDGYTVTPCFPGHACLDGDCRALAANVIFIFDTSGSMNTKVSGTSCPPFSWPDKCEQSEAPCTRMGVSKQIVAKALAAIDPQRTRLAMFRFPQVVKASAISCTSGYYEGQETLSGDDDSHAVTEETPWYWKGLHEILCAAFPTKPSDTAQATMAEWMDGIEVPGTNPELRQTGGTPIGKTLFYVGEYLRHRVVVDGRACIVDGDCGQLDYRCQQGWCVDPARDCRETWVVLFTDGGESNDPTDFFGPLVQARRLAFGLACQTSADCVGGASCTAKGCMPPGGTGYRCMTTGAPCKPGDVDPASPTGCPHVPGQDVQCLPDPIPLQTAVADDAAANVLRAPNGKPFGVRLHVVDISGQKKLDKSFLLSAAGAGRLFGVDAADSSAFLAALVAVLDVKSEAVCGLAD